MITIETFKKINNRMETCLMEQHEFEFYFFCNYHTKSAAFGVNTPAELGLSMFLKMRRAIMGKLISKVHRAMNNT